MTTALFLLLIVVATVCAGTTVAEAAVVVTSLDSIEETNTETGAFDENGKRKSDNSVNKSDGNDDDDAKPIVHRLFPAAKIESYNPDNLPPILGVLSGSGVNFALVSVPNNSNIKKKKNSSSSNNNKNNSIDEKATANNDATPASGGEHHRSAASANTPASTSRKSTSRKSTSRKRRTRSSGGSKNYETVDANKFLHHAVARFRNSLKRYPEFKEDYPPNPAGLSLVPINRTIEIALLTPDTSLYHGVPEDYEIELKVLAKDQNTDDDENRFVRISIAASTVFGVLRALESLAQLLEFGWMDQRQPMPNNNNKAAASTSGNDGDSSSTHGVFVVRDLPVFVSDEPAFSYRGLMIDTARHYLPVGLILDNLDAMETNKMNVLHWHLTDSQSFPYSPLRLPELAARGAYHPRRIYDRSDAASVVREAYLRGIRVVPEIDTPGHTGAIAASHPEVMSHCPDASEPLNPTVPETYELLGALYEDLAEVFPEALVHLGGDEVWMTEDCWLKDPSIASWMIDHGMGNRTADLREHFEKHLLEKASALGKTPIVWQEVFDSNLSLPEKTIVDVWKGFDGDTLANATDKNHEVILSGCWYLDHLSKGWESFYYECDPLNFTGGNKNLVIGGHASMWGEHVDASNFLSRVWPRASATAERLWHGSGGDASVAAASTVVERIRAFRCRMVRLGFPAEPTGPGACPTDVAYARRREPTANDRPRYNNKRQQEQETTIVQRENSRSSEDYFAWKKKTNNGGNENTRVGFPGGPALGRATETNANRQRRTG